MKVMEDQLIRDYLDRIGAPEEIVRAALEDQPVPPPPPAPASSTLRRALIAVGVVVVFLLVVGLAFFLFSASPSAPPMP